MCKFESFSASSRVGSPMRNLPSRLWNSLFLSLIFCQVQILFLTLLVWINKFHTGIEVVMMSFLWLVFVVTCRSSLSIPVLLLCLWLEITDNCFQTEAQLVPHPIFLCYFVHWIHTLWHSFLLWPGLLSSTCFTHQSWDTISYLVVTLAVPILFLVAIPQAVSHLFLARGAVLIPVRWKQQHSLGHPLKLCHSVASLFGLWRWWCLW
jgi:hypothetical protein